MKKISELKKLPIESLNYVNSGNIKQWAEQNLEKSDLVDGVDVYAFTIENRLCFLGSYIWPFALMERTFLGSFTATDGFETAELVGVHNGYAEVAFADGNKSLLVLGTQTEKALTFGVEMKPFFDRIYRDPSPLYDIPQELLMSAEKREAFKTIALCSLSDKAKQHLKNQFDTMELLNFQSKISSFDAFLDYYSKDKE